MLDAPLATFSRGSPHYEKPTRDDHLDTVYCSFENLYAANWDCTHVLRGPGVSPSVQNKSWPQQ